MRKSSEREREREREREGWQENMKGSSRCVDGVRRLGGVGAHLQNESVGVTAVAPAESKCRQSTVGCWN